LEGREVKIRIIKHVMAIVLAAALIFAPAKGHISAMENQVSVLPQSLDGNAEIKSREEVIYAVAHPDGRIDAVYAVNHFILATAGKLTDYGRYSAVTNLTNTNPVIYSNDTINAYVNGENFYYQGDMTENRLPWIFGISYYLNGKRISPEDLAGSSGQLEIHIKTRKDEAVNPVFYENYMLQISIKLDMDKSSGINAPDAVLANAGKNKVVTYTVLPGRDEDFILTANVRDFAMEGIEIAGMPFSMNVDLPKTDSMLDGFGRLTDGIAKLNNGVSELKSGISQLKNGAESLKSGSSDIKSGLSRLTGNSGQLLQASSQIKSALAQVSVSLKGPSDEMDLSQLVRLPRVLSQLADGLDQINSGLTELKGSFTLAHRALAAAIQEMPDTVLGEDQIGALYMLTMANDPNQLAVLDELVASYKAGLKVKGTYDHVKDAFNAVDPVFNKVSENIKVISDTLKDISEKMNVTLSEIDMTQQLKELTEGITLLAKKYEEFHKGLKDYMDGVDKLSLGYNEFHSGLSELNDGIDVLYDGASQLHDGTQKLEDETSDLPEKIENKIDNLLEEYTVNDFKPVSFTSPKNKKVDLVQFVIRCKGIEQKEETASEDAESIHQTIWDRIVNLFKVYFKPGS